MWSQDAHKNENQHDTYFVAFMLLIICFYLGCTHVMMHKGQTQI
jgi:uncharacterized membrane protein